jgi:hypothetical protein
MILFMVEVPGVMEIRDSVVRRTGVRVVPYASWNATAGWDPVSGLGTPNFATMKKIAVGK